MGNRTIKMKTLKTIKMRTIKFELSKEQIEKLNVWQEAIRVIHGEYGLYEYRFTPTGIGDGVTVYSHIAKAELDLTEYDKW